MNADIFYLTVENMFLAHHRHKATFIFPRKTNSCTRKLGQKCCLLLFSILKQYAEVEPIDLFHNLPGHEGASHTEHLGLERRKRPILNCWTKVCINMHVNEDAIVSRTLLQTKAQFDDRIQTSLPPLRRL